MSLNIPQICGIFRKFAADSLITLRFCTYKNLPKKLCVSAKWTAQLRSTDFPRSPDPESFLGNPKIISRIFKKLINPEKSFWKFLESLPDPEKVSTQILYRKDFLILTRLLIVNRHVFTSAANLRNIPQICGRFSNNTRIFVCTKISQKVVCVDEIDRSS
jgi:hypothetical protein